MFVTDKEKNENMPQNNVTNGNDYQYHPIVIGDILLHSEIKLPPIQVIIQPVNAISSQTFDQPNIPRLLPNSSGIQDDQTKISCDLKNSTTVKLIHERTLSKKKLMRIRKAGWTLVKELKSKIIKVNKTEPKISTGNIDSDNSPDHL